MVYSFNTWRCFRNQGFSKSTRLGYSFFLLGGYVRAFLDLSLNVATQMCSSWQQGVLFRIIQISCPAARVFKLHFATKSSQNNVKQYQSSLLQPGTSLTSFYFLHSNLWMYPLITPPPPTKQQPSRPHDPRWGTKQNTSPNYEATHLPHAEGALRSSAWELQRAPRVGNE